jgi:peptidoglycan/LPS O-acetylase OafA/YrhL
VALLVFAIVVLTMAGRFGDFTGIKSLITFPAVTLACVALILATLNAPMLSARSRVSQVLVYLGRISYCLYVFHLMFVMLFNVVGTHDPMDRTIRVVETLLATIALAAASYHLLERPFLRRKERFAHVQSRPV